MTAPATILVVEDDDDLRNLLAVVLAGEGFSVRTAPDGHEALADIAAHGMPGLILLDMRMPRMSGPEFARALERQYPARAPVIAITAAADPREAAAQVNALDWLSKPFEVPQLLAAVARVLPGASP